MNEFKLWMPILAVVCCTTARIHAYDENPLVILLELPAPQDSGGGIIVADVNHDEKPDFLVHF